MASNKWLVSLGTYKGYPEKHAHPHDPKREDIGRHYEAIIRVNSQSGKAGGHHSGPEPPWMVHPQSMQAKRYSSDVGVSPNSSFTDFRNSHKGFYKTLLFQVNNSAMRGGVSASCGKVMA